MNESARDYLNHYLEIENPSFAVLIKGNWGSGKTWFIKRFTEAFTQVKKRTDSDFKDPFVFVSLYGVNSISEIDEKIFEQLHPILSSAPVKIASSFVKSALKLGLSIPIGTGSVSGNIPDIELKALLKKFEDKVMVFDDLERSNLDLKTLFGCINSFVEIQRLRTIILANDKEINDKELFSQTQEKIIGKTFSLQPDIQNAVDSFFDEVRDEDTKLLLNESKGNIVEIFEKLGNSNLRNLRQSILHFEYFHKLIGLPYRNKKEFVKELVTPFFVLSLQNKNGAVDKENWKTALSGYVRHKMDVKSYAKYLQDKSHEAEALYGNLYLAESTPLLDLWPDVVIEGAYEPERIRDSISKAKYFLEETVDPLTKLMRTFRHMSKKEFSETVEIVISRLKANAYTHPGDILHVFDILALFSQWGLVDISIAKLKTMVSLQIESLVRSKSLAAVDISSADFLHFGGFAYSMKDTKEFKSLHKTLLESGSKLIRDNLKSELDKLMGNFAEGFTDFCKNLMRGEHYGKYVDYPILADLDAKVFAKKYAELDMDSQNTLVYAFRDRYELKYSNGQIQDVYYPEMKFVESLVSEIASIVRKEGVLGNPQIFVLSKTKKDIEKVIEKFESQTKGQDLPKKIRPPRKRKG